MRKIKTNMLLTASVIVATLLFSSCGKEKSGYNLDYLAVQLSKGDSWSIIDKEGNVVVKEEYPAESEISEIRDGVYWVKTGDKYQLYDIENPKKPVIDEEFSDVTIFSAGVAVVSNPNEQIRFIDTNGKTVTTLGKHIKRCYLLSEEGYAAYCTQENLWGIIDCKGKDVIKAIFSNIISWNDGIVLAEKRTDNNLVILDIASNKTLGEINTEKYDRMFSYISEEKLVVKNAGNEEGSYIVLDKTGKKLFDIKKSFARLGCLFYSNGYLVFGNEDQKYGVANDKGEITIRPKYDDLINNLGEGLFMAKKGEKWGVIDSEDNMVIDFDYSDRGFRMGDKFVMPDGNSYSLINRDGKEIISFDAITAEHRSYVDYVDMDGLSTSVINTITELEKALPISQAVKTAFKDLNIENAHYSRGLTHKDNIDDKIQLELELMYDDNLAEEKTHVEKVNDGWFTYERKVSDGWNWSNAIPQNISGTISLSYGKGINIKDLYKTLMTKLSEGRMKISDTKYSKTVKTRNETVECQTELTLNDENIGVEMVFRR